MRRALLFVSFLTVLLSSCVNREEKGFDLGDIPQDWVRLTETDTGLIVFNSCEAGNLLVKFEPNSRIVFHGQQEDDFFEISQVKKSDSNLITVTTVWEALNEETIFDIDLRQKNQGLALIKYKSKTRQGREMTFVEKDLVDNYPIVDQPCRECWPEEECDENE